MINLTGLTDRSLVSIWDKLSKDERLTLLGELRRFTKYKDVTLAELPFMEAFAVYLALSENNRPLKMKLSDFYSGSK